MKTYRIHLNTISCKGRLRDINEFIFLIKYFKWSGNINVVNHDNEVILTELGSDVDSNDQGCSDRRMWSRPVAMGWHGVANATYGQQGASFLAPLRTFSVILYCCFIFRAKDRSPEMLAEINLGLCDILESSVFSCTHTIHLIVIT